MISIASAQTPTPTPGASFLDVCQYCGEPGAYTTISAAIAAAQPGDTINIWGEEDSENEGQIYEYVESLVIDTPIILTCQNPEAELGYPIITHDFTGSPAPDTIIAIEPGGDASVIEHLIIRGPATGPVTTCPDYPMICMGQKSGIHIAANSCLINDCRITRCMTGIVMMTLGNTISGCTIGDRWLVEYGNTYHREEYWSATHEYEPGTPTPIYHPGNGFGIVSIEPGWSAPGSGYESRNTNEIVDSIVRSNRYYGVVLTNGSRALVSHNIIAWNGDTSITMSTGIPDKSGGLLSLFTEDQINSTYNDNKLQCPVIQSNNIYGNKGYQIAVMTGSDDCTTIYNSPVIMNNNIGVEDGMPPVSSPGNYDFLVCAGPTPDSTPVNPPDPCESNYEYYGSGPLFGWNNYHDPTEGHQRRMYHPGQKDKRWPGPVPPTSTETPVPTITPTPTVTPSPTITNTFTPGPRPTNTPMEPSPTPQPADPTPSTPTHTPEPGYYQMGDQNWEIPGLREDPRFVGWVTPTPEGPPEYDWHLRDYEIIEPTGTPPEATITPSLCFNRGGFDLNPGATRADGERDTGYVDLGRHVKEPVPMIENLRYDGSSEPPDTILWDVPDHYPDGTAIPFWEIGGYIVCWGLNGTPVGQLVYLDASTQEFQFDNQLIPGKATHLGVTVYNIRLIESDISWIELPK